MRKEKIRKKKSKVMKAIAFSEMFVMVLASFAFAFILSGGIVSGVTYNEINENYYLNGLRVTNVEESGNEKIITLSNGVILKKGSSDVVTESNWQSKTIGGSSLEGTPSPGKVTTPKPSPSDSTLTKEAALIKKYNTALGTANTALEIKQGELKSLETAKSRLTELYAELNKKGVSQENRDYINKQIKELTTAHGTTQTGSSMETKDNFNKAVDVEIKTKEAEIKISQEKLADAQLKATTAKEVGGSLSDEKIEAYPAALAAKEAGTETSADLSLIAEVDAAKEATSAAQQAMTAFGPDKYTLVPGFEAGKVTWGGLSGHFFGNLIEGVWWAGAVVGGIKIFESIGLIPSEYAQPLYSSLAGGILAGKATYGLIKGWGASLTQGGKVAGGKFTSILANYGGAFSFAVGAITAYLIFSYNYKKDKTETRTLTFKCMSWQAPRGGNSCGECNKDPMKPCSEYRCKALGQSCELLNKGTGQEKCEWVNRNDAISPGIKPWPNIITNGYTYAQVKPRPAGGASATSGMWIERATENSNGNKCIDPYTPIEFGILTYNEKNQAEPAQCKIEYQHTNSFSEMGYYFGDSNLYLTNHSQKLSIPSISSLKTMNDNSSEGLEMEQTPGEYTFYVRCSDANGNENRDEFAVRFCVDEGPDMTAPVIKGTSFGNQTTPVQFGQDNLSIEVYTNEPARCFWEREDRDYNYMGNEMQCSNNVFEMNAEFLYTCKTTLTSIEDRKNNDFFFRCVDLSDNKNAMQEGYQFTVMGTQPLDIIAVGPNGTIAGSTSIVKTTLHIETANGYNNGEARCFYSSTGENSSYIEFFYNTSEFANIHDQLLDLGSGTYDYYFKCIDLGGNSAENSTTFTLEMDREAPLVVRAYNENNQLLLITDESSDCRYDTQSCGFNFNDGLPMSNANSTTHEAEWKEQNYYIKCADGYNNQPDTMGCSIIVRPYLG